MRTQDQMSADSYHSLGKRHAFVRDSFSLRAKLSAQNDRKAVLCSALVARNS